MMNEKTRAQEMVHLKMWALAYANSPTASLKRKALYQYLGILFWLADIPGVSERDEPQERKRKGDEWAALVGPLVAIQEALRQADNFEVPDFFQDAFKPEITNRPPLSRSKQMCWSFAAAVITILMDEYGVNGKKEAAQLVEKHLRLKGIEVPTTRRSTAPAWKRLLDKRDKCMAASSPKELTKRYYLHALSFYAGTSGFMDVNQLLDYALDGDFRSFEPSTAEDYEEILEDRRAARAKRARDVLRSLQKPPTV